MALRKQKRFYPVIYVLLALIAILQILPLIVTFMNSLRADGDIKKIPVGIPTELNISNYSRAWEIGKYGQAFLNSILVSVSVSSIVLASAIISGYFLSRSKIKLKKYLFVYYGVSLSIPVFAFLVPLYYTFANLNLVNSHFGLILTYIAINLPFNILLARTFIMGIPRELDEAAIIDGCSTYQLIWRIIFPLSKPIITTIVLIVFVATWNEFTIANTFLQTQELKTAATKYVLFVTERGSDLAMVYTAAIITMLPIVAAFIALQNYFIEGMTSGSIK